MRRRDFPKAIALTAAGSLLLSKQAQAQTAPYPKGHLFRYLTQPQIDDYSAGTMSLDLADELQAWADDCIGITGYLPPGTARISAPISLASGTTLRGDGSLSRIAGWGCDCLVVNGDRVVVEKLGLFDLNSSGSADSRTNTGIKIAGTSSTARNYFTGRDLFLQGFLYAVNGEYAWNSVLDNVDTINVEYGVRLFGQSVNNCISNSRLVCNSGSASIVASKDGTTQGEGLAVSNCLLASGDSAFRSNGFLSAGFYNCTCDLLAGIGFDLTAVQAFYFNGPWVYATNACFKWAALSSATEIGAVISVARAETIGSDHLISWGANNTGLSILGGQLILRGGPGYPMVFSGPQASVVGVNVINGTAQTGALVNAADVHFEGISGDKTVTWLVPP